MPTYEATPRFTADHHRLTPEQRRRFRQAVAAFVDDLRTGRQFRPGLREARGFAESWRGPWVNTYAGEGPIADPVRVPA